MHLHRDDVPDSRALLDRLLVDRDTPPVGPSAGRFWADDWDLLGDSYLSTV